MSKSLTELGRGLIDDQEDIKRIKNKSKPSLASILHELKEELKSQNDLLAEFQAQDWKDEDEFIAVGWIEGLEFAIKLIEEHNRSCEADQYSESVVLKLNSGYYDTVIG